MANLGNLWFTLGLSTDKFKQEIKSSAVDLNELKEKIKALGIEWNSLGKTDATRYKVAVKLVSQIAQEQEKVTRETQKTANAQKEANKQLSSQSNLVKNLANYAKYYVNFFAAQRLVSSLVNITGEFEQQRIALKQIIGDVMVAEGIYNRIKALAVESPFEFKELVNYTKQLTAFSVPAGELYDTMKMLADVSAGLGVGMDRLVLAYGQIRSASFLRGQEVRQLTEAGVPILEELRKQFEAMGEIGITAGQVFDKISQRQVTFEMVKKVFVDMTSEGGKFYKMQEVLADSLKGKISNLKDAYQIMMSEIGERHSEGLKNTVDMMRKLMDNWENAGKTLLQLISIYGAFKAATATAHIANMIKQYGGLREAIVRLNVVQKILNSTLLKNPWVLLATAVTAVVGAIIKAKSNAEALHNELSKIGETWLSDAKSSVSQFERLSKQLNESTKGSENYREAIRKLNSQYGEYLPNLLNEADALNTLNRAYQNVISSIYKKHQAQAESEGYAKIEDEYGAIANSARSKFIKLGQDLLGFEKDALNDVLNLFDAEMRKQNFAANPIVLINQTFKKYFNDPNMKFMGGSILPAVNEYFNATKKLEEERNKFEDELKSIYGQGYNTAEERQMVTEVDNWYKKELANLKDSKKSTEEYNDALKNLNITKLQKLEEIYNKLGRSDMLNDVKNQLDKYTKVPEGWIKTANDIIEKSGLKLSDGIGAAKPQEDASWYEYVDSIAEGYKDIKDKIDKAGEGNKAQIPTLIKVKGLYEDIMRTLKISEKKSSGGDGKPKRVTELEQEYQLVKTLIGEYNKLKREYPEKSDADIFSELRKAFGDNMKTTDFDSWVGRITAELQKLGEYGKDAAEKILNKDVIQEGTAAIDDIVKKWREEREAIEKAQKAFEKYQDTISKWSAEDFTISGTGALFDVSKALRDLKTKKNEIFLQKKEAEIELDATKEKYSQQEYNLERLRIEGLYRTNIEYERKLTAEKIKELGKRYGQDAVKDNTKIKTGDYADLSLGQIRTSIYELNQLLSMTDSQIAGLLSDEDREKLKEAGLSLQDFIDAYREYLRLKEQDNETEAFKKTIASAQKVNKYISELSSSLKNLGNAGEMKGLTYAAKILGNMVEFGDIVLDTLKDIKGAVSDTSKAGDEFSEASTQLQESGKNFANSIMSSSDWITMIVKAITWVATKVIEFYTAKVDEQIEREKKLREAALEVIKMLEEDRSEANLSEKIDSLFGENVFRKIKNAADEVNRLNTELDYYIDIFTRRRRGLGFDLNENGELIVGKQVLEDLNLIDEEIKVINKDGTLNTTALETMTKWFDAIGGNPEDFEKAIQYAKSYQTAMEQLNESIQSMFNNMASNVADNMIEAFNNTGDAMNNLEDSFKSLGSSFIKTLLQSMIIENVFDKYQDRLRGILSSSEDEMTKQNQLYDLMGEMEDDLAIYKDSINAFLSAAEQKGWTGESSSNTLKSSIQGITEETASRVANLLNGIYSESFRQGALMDELLMYVGAMDIAGINDNLNLGLVELRAINENTLRSANNSDRIVDAINNLITYGGQTAMNVRLLN